MRETIQLLAAHLGNVRLKIWYHPVSLHGEIQMQESLAFAFER
jgi:hypothetical protein